MSAEDEKYIEEVNDNVDVGAEEDVEYHEEAEEEGADEDEVADEAEVEGEERGGDKGAADANDKSTAGADVNTKSFDELRVDEKSIVAANDVWRLFINTAESREAAGEVIYSALFESAPSLQSLFVTPRAVQAMKFMNGIASFVTTLHDPPKLKILVETLGFGHLHLDVTVPRVVIFRDAILDIFAVELAEKFTSTARDAWTRLLNYVGGAIIYVKANYADRINTLLESWKIATAGKGSDGEAAGEEDDELAKQKAEEVARQQELQRKKKSTWAARRFAAKNNKNADGVGEAGAGEGGAGEKGDSGSNALNANQVPTTYNEMFRFNSAVMGFGTSAWMSEVLDCFHNIVTNVANSARLQEECDVLVLRISRVAKGNVNFGEYKSCMLASLRSLLPKSWSTQHEVSWSWLWENVERIMNANMGKPPKWEKALGKVISSLDENTKFELRKDIYARFFAAAPAGQDFFKQSNTYLHFIADRIIEMTLEIYQNPVKMVDDVSALGLRHVGYAIPTEFFGPFVSACVEVIQSATTDVDCVESFRWSLGLIAKMLVRTIQEGSTIVMKAINSNNAKALRKAIGCAPRGERADWQLMIQVGTQNISPLAWSIESGALESAQAIVVDLLTFRADRDRYYYGMDALFQRHPEIVKTLASDAPTVLPKLLDGLIWRSRTTENGMRRCNFYLRHLLIDVNGNFSPTLKWVAKTNDPRLVCHPILALLSDTVWGRVAQRTFLFRKSWFLFTLAIFICGQSVLKYAHLDNLDVERALVFGFRAFIYFFSMTQLLYTHLTKCARQIRTKQIVLIFGRIPVPAYLKSWQDAAGLALATMLVFMLILEPILWCMANNDGDLFTQMCSEADDIIMPYSVFSMLAMLLYFALVIDLAVLSTKVSAYVLVCTRMLSEVSLFLLALSATLLAFASGISVIKHEQGDFAGIHKGLLSLLEMTMRMYDGQHYAIYESDAVVLICVFIFLVVVMVFLLNMLVAQLTCAYEAVYVDMIGYARLERITVIVGIMPLVSNKRWFTFCDSLRLDQKCEFNAGDIGVTGGMPIVEAANLNPTTVDTIRRFGGSTSVEMQWPAEQEGQGDEDDRFERMENLIQKTLKRITKGGGGKGGQGSSGQSGSNSNSNGMEDDMEASDKSSGEAGGGDAGEDGH